MHVRFFLLGFGLLVAGCGGGQRTVERTISLEGEVERLVQVEHLAETPVGELHMLSTYDITGANLDFQRVREPGPDGLVEVARIEGPGCLYRMWKVSVGARYWCFFVDGEEEPRIRLTPEQLFGGDGSGGLFTAPLSDRISSGYYCYLPIPFEKSLRIAYESLDFWPGRTRFYQFNYRIFPEGTRVNSFPRQPAQATVEQVRAVADRWREVERDHREAMAAATVVAEQEVAPGAALDWLRLDGRGQLAHFFLRPIFPEGATVIMRERMLRQVSLHVFYDGRDEASIDVPFGDFFCNGLDRHDFASLTTAVLGDQFSCRWPMPFADGLRLVLRNNSVMKLRFAGGYGTVESAHAVPNYLHAAWNSAEGEGRPYEVLRDQGAGHYVGVYLNAIGMENPRHRRDWNLLESDETFRLNREIRPSWSGTGMEDYFNGAWYYKGLFDLPLHGLLDKAGTRTAQYRVHVHDRVGYHDGLSFHFEFGQGNSAQGYLSSVAFFYKPEPTAVAPLPPAGERFPPRDPNRAIGLMAGLFELERLERWGEAGRRCLRFVQEFPQASEREHFELRALMYRQRMEGFEAVRSELLAMRERVGSDTRQQIDDWLWMHESDEHFLLGLNPNGSTRLFLDGRQVAASVSPRNMTVVRVVLDPGVHTLAAEIEPARLDAWFSCHLRGRGLRLRSDASWETTASEPAGWPQQHAGEWVGVKPPGPGEMLPRDHFWRIEVNPWVGFQSAQQLLRPWQVLPEEARKGRVYLRRTFEVPEN